MILLDTDHLTVLKYPESANFRSLVDRMESSGEAIFAITIVSVEEQMRGWLALIHKVRDLHKQVLYYHQLELLFELFRRWRIVPFDDTAAKACVGLRKQKIRIGTQGLKFGAIALTQDSLLLSANLRDFRLVPNLRVESWIG